MQKGTKWKEKESGTQIEGNTNVRCQNEKKGGI